jgi:hypothetical protein
MENHAKYAETIYFHDNQTLYVNLFIASELTWKAKGLVVRQETQFPESDAVKLTLRCEKPLPLALKIRWPSWAQKGFGVVINGKETKMDGKPGSYVTLERDWHDGDTVELRLPMSLQKEELPANNPRIVALLHGPIVLAGELGTEGLEKVNPWSQEQCGLDHIPTPILPQVLCEPGELLGKLEPVAGKSMTYRTKGIGRPAEITLSPFYKLHYQRYSVYWKLLNEAEWKERQDQIAAEEAKHKADEARIVDEVRPGEQQPEVDHKFRGERSKAGDFRDCKWRDAVNGWFSYEMKVAAEKPMTLRCRYWGSDVGRHFDILIDGEKIATQTLPKDKESGLFYEDYAVPAPLVQGKERVTVTFQARPGSIAGGVFHVLMLKP